MWLSSAVAAVTACAIIADVPQLQARDAFSPVNRFALQSDSVSKKTTSPSQYIRVADDYCNSRCDQQFKYCQYRAESRENCVRLLTKCRANC
jgi:hypothetical protein